MTVHFIGAGPGAPDLLTLRGRDLIAKCNVCLFAGSLVPEGVLTHCPEDALTVDTAPMHLDQIIEMIVEHHEKGEDIARVHSGDPSLYGAIAEQMRRLDALGVRCDARHVGVVFGLPPAPPRTPAWPPPRTPASEPTRCE